MIIDASVALKWLVVEEGSEAALALLPQIDLSAPTLLHSEVANALRRKQRRGELADDIDPVRLMDRLAQVIQTVDEVPIMGRSLALAALLDHAAYDCVYLALAEQLGQELVTADMKFLRKVETTELAVLVRPL